MEQELKICILQADDLHIENEYIQNVSDDVFFELAKEKNSVYAVQEFVDKFNLEEIIVSSENSYLRLVKCNK